MTLAATTIIMNSKIDASLLSVNRSKLMKLAEGIKTKKKSGHNKKTALNFKKDPGYTNIEHLVFGTYRPKASPSTAAPSASSSASSTPNEPRNGCAFNNCDHNQQRDVLTDHDEHLWTSLPVQLNEQSAVVKGADETMRNLSPSSDAADLYRHRNGDFEARPVSKSTPMTSPFSHSSPNGSVNGVRSSMGPSSIKDATVIMISGEHCDSPASASLGRKNRENSDVFNYGIIEANETLDHRSPIGKIMTSSCCSSGKSANGNRRNNYEKPTGCCSSATTTTTSSPDYRGMPSESNVATSSNFVTRDLDVSANNMRDSVVLKSESCPDVPSNSKSNWVDSEEQEFKGKPILKTSTKPTIMEQRQSVRTAPAIRGVNNNNRLTSSFGHGPQTRNPRPTSGIIQATSAQTKVLVSASNPSRPTLSTKVKLTVSTDGTTRSVGDVNLVANTNQHQPKLARNSFCSTKSWPNTNRNSALLNVSYKPTGPAGRGNVTRTDRPRFAPSASNLLGAQSRSSSICSLASRKHPGSTSSLEYGGHQNAMSSPNHRPRSAKSETSAAAVAARRSFHVGAYQRSVSAREPIKATAPSSTRSPNAIPKQLGRMSLRLPVANVSRPLSAAPTKAISAALHLPPERHASAIVARSKNCRIPQYKFSKNISRETAVVVKNDSVAVSHEMTAEEHSKFDRPVSEHSKPEMKDECPADLSAAASPSANAIRDIVASTDARAFANVDEGDVMNFARLTDNDFADDVLVMGTCISSAALTSDAKIVPLVSPCDSSLERQKNRWRPPLPARSVSLATREAARPLHRGRRLSAATGSTISYQQTEESAAGDCEAVEEHVGRNQLTTAKLLHELSSSAAPTQPPSHLESEIARRKSHDGVGPIADQCDGIQVLACIGAIEPDNYSSNDAITIAVERISQDVDVVASNGADAAEEPSQRNVAVDGALQQQQEDSCGPFEDSRTSSSPPPRSGHLRTVPKCVRRLKAASSPVFSESRVDSWVSEGDLRRPWSQICTEQDAVQCLAVQASKSKAISTDTGSMAVGIDVLGHHGHPMSDSTIVTRGQSDDDDQQQQQANLFARFSSMRQHPNARAPPPTTVEGVLQKFRKSFSARFYKKVKGADSPTSVSKSCRHASFSSYLVEGSPNPLQQNGVEADMTSMSSAGGCVNGSGGSAGGMSFVHSSVSDVSATDSTSSDGGIGGGGGGGNGNGNETVFRLGPIVWRSSKERKEKAKKQSKKGFVLVDSTAISTPELNGLTDSCNRLSTQNDEASCCASKRLSASTTPLLPTWQHNGSLRPSPVHCPTCNNNNKNYSVGVSPQVLRRRAPISTSLRFERQKRPLSDQSSLHGSVIMPNGFEVSRNGESKTDSSGHFRPLRNCGVDRALYSSSNEVGVLPPLVIVRRQKKMPLLRWSKGRSNLRRSISQPLEMEKLEALNAVSISNNPGGLSDQEENGHDLSMASSEEEIGSDAENTGKTNGYAGLRGCKHCVEYSEPVVYAEALWDHVTMDTEELAFKAGNLIEVLDDSDPEWWWGVIGNKAGWFPAPFVRTRVNQEDTVEDCVAKMSDGSMCSQANRKMPISLLSNDQVRTNVIMEIVSTEKDFVRHLKDVCEGYLKQVRKRPDMFSEDRVSTIFGNIEQLYTFQSSFVSKLEQCINWELPHLSKIGSCFTENREGFEMYSEYCNNHSQAVSELQELYTNTKYAHFFEACRLLQDMIDISLDGFLLTPVQKICKYPLQLAELLKYTRADHPDHRHAAEALETMRSVAQYINERKRRMECLEKLAAWQLALEYWEGPDLLDKSSELIHSGEVSKVTAAWSRDFTFFLFDHQIIICKKDLLKRNSYSYKSRIDMDLCEVVDVADGKDASTGMVLKNGWKMFCSERAKWLVFATKTADEKQRWMKAFESERRRVDDDRRQGFVVTEKAKRTATMVVLTRRNPKKPKDKENKGVNARRSGRANGRYVISSKSGSLPSNLLLSTNAGKKKAANASHTSTTSSSSSSGWFHFGSNKKSKR